MYCHLLDYCCAHTVYLFHLIPYLFLWIIYYKQLHNISSLRNKYSLMFIPSVINIYCNSFFYWINILQLMTFMKVTNPRNWYSPAQRYVMGTMLWITYMYDLIYKQLQCFSLLCHFKLWCLARLSTVFQLYSICKRNGRIPQTCHLQILSH